MRVVLVNATCGERIPVPAENQSLWKRGATVAQRAARKQASCSLWASSNSGIEAALGLPKRPREQKQFITAPDGVQELVGGSIPAMYLQKNVHEHVLCWFCLDMAGDGDLPGHYGEQCSETPSAFPNNLTSTTQPLPLSHGLAAIGEGGDVCPAMPTPPAAPNQLLAPIPEE